MKEKEIAEVVESRFKTINKLPHKIIKEFNADNIHDFRVEVKKLRAFLRLLDTEKKMERPLIPKLLKTFYGYIGIIRNIQLHRNNLTKYISDYKIESSQTYLKILDNEQHYREKDAEQMMEDNNFDGTEETILKRLPGKLEKSAIKKFIEKKLDELKIQLANVNDGVAIHSIRKILKDILYTWDYTKHHANLPAAVSKEEDLKLLTSQLGGFRDKCIQLEFLQPQYLDKIKDENEKNIMLKIKEQFLREKKIMIQELTYSFNELREQL
jgi:CHAD domain-containing protein